MPKINEICDVIASLEMEPHDAELLRKMMFDFRDDDRGPSHGVVRQGAWMDAALSV